MKQKHFSVPAFTLIELVIVVAIVGILTSTVTVSLRAFQLKSQANQAVTDILRVTEYIESYKANYGAYPLSCGDGSGWASRNNNPWGCGLGACWIGQFSAEGWCPLPYNTNNPPAYNPAADQSQYIYYSNGVNYKLLYHNAVSMGVPNEFIDSIRPTWAFGTWSPGAAAW
ncbi:MAG: type IV pilin protein [Undibacterium sp.]